MRENLTRKMYNKFSIQGYLISPNRNTVVLISIDSAQHAGLKTNLWLKEKLPFEKTLSRLCYIGTGFVNLLDHQLSLMKH